MVTAQLVKELRDATNLGILDCKKALEATNGNIDAAIDWLREKGIAKAAKKESRIAAEGLANIYVSGNKAVILRLILLLKMKTLRKWLLVLVRLY